MKQPIQMLARDCDGLSLPTVATQEDSIHGANSLQALYAGALLGLWLVPALESASNGEFRLDAPEKAFMPAEIEAGWAALDEYARAGLTADAGALFWAEQLEQPPLRAVWSLLPWILRYAGDSVRLLERFQRYPGIRPQTVAVSLLLSHLLGSLQSACRLQGEPAALVVRAVSLWPQRLNHLNLTPAISEGCEQLYRALEAVFSAGNAEDADSTKLGVELSASSDASAFGADRACLDDGLSLFYREPESAPVYLPVSSLVVLSVVRGLDCIVRYGTSYDQAVLAAKQYEGQAAWYAGLLMGAIAGPSGLPISRQVRATQQALFPGRNHCISLARCLMANWQGYLRES